MKQEHNGLNWKYKQATDLLFVLQQDTMCHKSMCYTEKSNLCYKTDKNGYATGKRACKIYALFVDVECLSSY